MPLRSLAALTLFAIALLGTSPARADLQAELGLQLIALVSGNDQPAIVLQPSRDVRSFVVVLTRDDANKQKLSAASIAAGAQRTLPLPQPAGSRHSYDAAIEVTWGDQAKDSMVLRFTMTRVLKLELALAPEDVDLDLRTMRFKINNPADRAELTIVGQEGKSLATITKGFQGAAGGSVLELGWDDPGKEVLYMDLKVYDIAGFWKGVRLTPFSISIPHDDVEFDTAKYNIRTGEEPKLKKTLELINDALAKHGTLLQLKLFVAGYTDTVGTKESNRTLSNNRARAIAGWFRNHGLMIPIFTQGFGEEVLAKPTPDETDEPANRRAVYILASQTPSTSAAIPKSAWQSL